MIIEILKITGIPEKGLIFWFKVSENVLEISVGMLIMIVRLAIFTDSCSTTWTST